MKKIVTALAAFALCFGLVACSGGETSGGGSPRLVGFEIEGATDVVVANGLDQDLVSLGYGNMDEGWSIEFDLTYEGGEPLGAGEECLIYMENEGQPVDITATSADGTVYEIPGVPVASGMTVKLVVVDGVAYAEYTDADGNAGNTKDATLARQAALEKEEADMAAADAVCDLAMALPVGDELTLDSEAAIVAARAAYDALTPEQKEFFGAQAALQMIEDAENALQALKDAASAEEAAVEEEPAEEESTDDGWYDDGGWDDGGWSDDGWDGGWDDGGDYYDEPAQSEDDCLDEPVYRN